MANVAADDDGRDEHCGGDDENLIERWVKSHGGYTPSSNPFFQTSTATVCARSERGAEPTDPPSAPLSFCT